MFRNRKRKHQDITLSHEDLGKLFQESEVITLVKEALQYNSEKVIPELNSMYESLSIVHDKEIRGKISKEEAEKTKQDMKEYFLSEIKSIIEKTFESSYYPDILGGQQFGSHGWEQRVNHGKAYAKINADLLNLNYDGRETSNFKPENKEYEKVKLVEKAEERRETKALPPSSEENIQFSPKQRGSIKYGYKTRNGDFIKPEGSQTLLPHYEPEIVGVDKGIKHNKPEKEPEVIDAEYKVIDPHAKRKKIFAYVATGLIIAASLIGGYLALPFFLKKREERETTGIIYNGNYTTPATQTPSNGGAELPLNETPELPANGNGELPYNETPEDELPANETPELPVNETPEEPYNETEIPEPKNNKPEIWEYKAKPFVENRRKGVRGNATIHDKDGDLDKVDVFAKDHPMYNKSVKRNKINKTTEELDFEIYLPSDIPPNEIIEIELKVQDKNNSKISENFSVSSPNIPDYCRLFQGDIVENEYIGQAELVDPEHIVEGVYSIHVYDEEGDIDYEKTLKSKEGKQEFKIPLLKLKANTPYDLALKRDGQVVDNTSFIIPNQAPDISGAGNISLVGLEKLVEWNFDFGDDRGLQYGKVELLDPNDIVVKVLQEKNFDGSQKGKLKGNTIIDSSLAPEKGYKIRTSGIDIDKAEQIKEIPVEMPNIPTKIISKDWKYNDNLCLFELSAVLEDMDTIVTFARYDIKKIGESIGCGYSGFFNIKSLGQRYNLSAAVNAEFLLKSVYNASCFARDSYELEKIFNITNIWANTAGLIGYFPFDEGSGDFHDQSGNNLGETGMRYCEYMKGIKGTALRFNETKKSYASIYNMKDKFQPEEITISIWSILSKLGDDDNLYRSPLINWGIGAPAGAGWFNLEYGFGGASYKDKLNFQTSRGGIENADVPSPLNNWRHIVATLDKNNISLYIDGKLVISSPSQGLLENNPYNYGIFLGKFEMPGTGGEYTRFYDGLLDEVKIFERVLSPMQIRMEYESVLG